MNEIRLEAPFSREKLKGLKAGDSVLITGTIYTARDEAHKRMVEMLRQGKKLPFDIRDAIIYYAGPAPARPGQVIGSVGPAEFYKKICGATEIEGSSPGVYRGMLR